MFTKLITGILTTGFCAYLLAPNMTIETNPLITEEPQQQEVQTTQVQEDCPYGNIECPHTGNHENCQSVSSDWECPDSYGNCMTQEQHQNHQNCVTANSSSHHNETTQRRGHHGGRHHN